MQKPTGDNRKAVWCLDATAIAAFDTMDEALREWNHLDDEVFIDFNGSELCVRKDEICVMTEEEFNTL